MTARQSYDMFFRFLPVLWYSCTRHSRAHSQSEVKLVYQGGKKIDSRGSLVDTTTLRSPATRIEVDAPFLSSTKANQSEFVAVAEQTVELSAQVARCLRDLISQIRQLQYCT